MVRRSTAREKFEGRSSVCRNGLFENQDRLGVPLFAELAEKMGLPSDELLAALQRGQFAPAVREHFMGGVRSRVNGTPTFFINGQRHEGAYEFEFLVEAHQPGACARVRSTTTGRVNFSRIS
jgi:2-hydroxychromene-2-carboxylate isomerase